MSYRVPNVPEDNQKRIKQLVEEIKRWSCVEHDEEYWSILHLAETAKNGCFRMSYGAVYYIESLLVAKMAKHFAEYEALSQEQKEAVWDAAIERRKKESLWTLPMNATEVPRARHDELMASLQSFEAHPDCCICDWCKSTLNDSAGSA